MELSISIGNVNAPSVGLELPQGLRSLSNDDLATWIIREHDLVGDNNAVSISVIEVSPSVI